LSYFARYQLIAAALLLTICAFSQSASADSTEWLSGCSGCNGYSFQATITSLGGNNYSLSYTINNVSGAPATAQNWSLTLFPSGTGVSSFSNLSVSKGPKNYTGSYNVLGGKSNNGTNGNCNSGLSNGICVTLSGTGSPALIGVGQSLNFSFNFNCTNCSSLSSWGFLSHGTCATGKGNCYAISTYGASAAVPDPPVSVLLASELGLMVGILVLFRPTRNRILQRCATLFSLQAQLTS
jgi:hypothetical protein